MEFSDEMRCDELPQKFRVKFPSGKSPPRPLSGKTEARQSGPVRLSLEKAVSAEGFRIPGRDPVFFCLHRGSPGRDQCGRWDLQQ